MHPALEYQSEPPPRAAVCGALEPLFETEAKGRIRLGNRRPEHSTHRAYAEHLSRPAAVRGFGVPSRRSRRSLGALPDRPAAASQPGALPRGVSRQFDPPRGRDADAQCAPAAAPFIGFPARAVECAGLQRRPQSFHAAAALHPGHSPALPMARAEFSAVASRRTSGPGGANSRTAATRAIRDRL